MCINFHEKNVLLQIYDAMCKTNMEIDSSGWLAMLKFLDILVKCSIEGACMKGLSSRTAALNTTSECLHILRLGFVYYKILLEKLFLHLCSLY